MERRPDWTIEQGWDGYTAAEHGVWRTLYARQTALLPGRACAAFVDGMRRLPIGPEEIPDFRRVNDILARQTGWAADKVSSTLLFMELQGVVKQLPGMYYSLAN